MDSLKRNLYGTGIERARVLLLFGLAIGFSGLAGTGDGMAGTVTDPSGAVMPDVPVVVRNTQAGVTQRAVTNAEGLYTFPALPAGNYELQVDHPNFLPYRQKRLEMMTPAAALRVDIVLEVRPQVESVTVLETGTQVEIADTQMGEAIMAGKMTSIPVNGRSFTDLLAIQPGVIPASSQQPNAVVMSGCTNAPPSGDLNPGNMSVSGRPQAWSFPATRGSPIAWPQPDAPTSPRASGWRTHQGPKPAFAPATACFTRHLKGFRPGS